MKIYITIEVDKHVVFEDVSSYPTISKHMLEEGIKIAKKIDDRTCNICEDLECLGEYTHHTTGDNTKNE